MDGEKHIEKLILEKLNNPLQKLTCNPILGLLIDGVCDEECPISIFAGFPHLLNTIWNNVLRYWETFITGKDDSDSDLYEEMEHDNIAFLALTDHPAYKFPEPRDIYINMMPFVMEKTFSKSRLPAYLKSYWDAIIIKGWLDEIGFFHTLIPKEECGKIGYLTIHESFVKKDKTQRRPGLHTDSPGKVTLSFNRNMFGPYVCSEQEGMEDHSKVICDLPSNLGKGICSQDIKDTSYLAYWGGGAYDEFEFKMVGGIYMMSNVSDSCEVYKCKVTSDKNGNEVIGDLGDVEHLEEVLPIKGRTRMEPNVMYWITDRTPHKSLPLQMDTYRQYFRLVTSEVSIWYEDHSTKNPNGVVPDPSITRIVKGSKFIRNCSL